LYATFIALISVVSSEPGKNSKEERVAMGKANMRYEDGSTEEYGHPEA
jgi:hypothetical protein